MKYLKRCLRRGDKYKDGNPIKKPCNKPDCPKCRYIDHELRAFIRALSLGTVTKSRFYWFTVNPKPNRRLGIVDSTTLETLKKYRSDYEEIAKLCKNVIAYPEISLEKAQLWYHCHYLVFEEGDSQRKSVIKQIQEKYPHLQIYITNRTGTKPEDFDHRFGSNGTVNLAELPYLCKYITKPVNLYPEGQDKNPKVALLRDFLKKNIGENGVKLGPFQHRYGKFKNPLVDDYKKVIYQTEGALSELELKEKEKYLIKWLTMDSPLFGSPPPDMGGVNIIKVLWYMMTKCSEGLTRKYKEKDGKLNDYVGKDRINTSIGYVNLTKEQRLVLSKTNQAVIMKKLENDFKALAQIMCCHVIQRKHQILEAKILDTLLHFEAQSYEDCKDEGPSWWFDPSNKKGTLEKYLKLIHSGPKGTRLNPRLNAKGLSLKSPLRQVFREFNIDPFLSTNLALLKRIGVTFQTNKKRVGPLAWLPERVNVHYKRHAQWRKQTEWKTNERWRKLYGMYPDLYKVPSMSKDLSEKVIKELKIALDKKPQIYRDLLSMMKKDDSERCAPQPFPILDFGFKELLKSGNLLEHSNPNKNRNRSEFYGQLFKDGKLISPFEDDDDS